MAAASKDMIHLRKRAGTILLVHVPAAACMRPAWPSSFRQKNLENRTPARCAFCGHEALMVFDYLPHNGKSDTGTLVFCVAVQPRENIKNAFRVALLETDAIILYGNHVKFVVQLFFGPKQPGIFRPYGFAVNVDLKQRVSKVQGTFTIIYKVYILIYNPDRST